MEGRIDPSGTPGRTKGGAVTLNESSLRALFLAVPLPDLLIQEQPVSSAIAIIRGRVFNISL
jgi:hypothetical protein